MILSKLFLHPKPLRTLSASFSSSVQPQFTTLQLLKPEKYPNVVHLAINRPEKSNAMNKEFFTELSDAMRLIDEDTKCRAVVLSGNGKNFSAGLDLKAGILELQKRDPDRQAYFLRKMILKLQEPFNLIENTNKPVIAAIQGACVGGAVDLISACDIRYCSSDSKFSIKEVDIGIAADLGTLQRLPKITGNHSLLRELVFTARFFSAQEALQLGLISSIHNTHEEVVEYSLNIAHQISQKSPIAVHGSKRNLNFSKDHSISSSLEYAATWNGATVQTADIMKALTQKNNFEDL